MLGFASFAATSLSDVKSQWQNKRKLKMSGTLWPTTDK